MNFLVTGGAGFIGSHIVENLLKRGNFVRVVDNFSSGKEENLAFTKAGGITNQFELVRGDITDKLTCNKACQGIDCVFHHAALRSVPESIRNPESYNKVNIDGTFYLLEAAAKNKVKRFVFASSSSIYGDVNVFPEREDLLPRPISPYALSKLAGEYYCRIFSANFGLETVSLRYFNVFGPRQALDDEYSVVIPKFIHCILSNKQPPIFGTGKQSRDFVYIDDVVQANILAATVPGISGSIYNVGTGKDITILGLAKSLNKILGTNIKPEFFPVRNGDVYRTKAEISRIKKQLGYKLSVSFDDGLKCTTEYFRLAFCK